MGLTPQEALDLFNSDDLLGIGMAANEVRRKKTDPRIATYQIDRNINYTNFCTEYCSFCAFYGPWARKTATSCRSRPFSRRSRKCSRWAEQACCCRAACIPTSKSTITKTCCGRFASAFRKCTCTAFPLRKSPASPKCRGFRCAIRSCGCGTRVWSPFPAAARKFWTMKCAHRISRLKCTSDEWEAVHRTAHELGMRTTATMMFGCGEEMRHRVNHLERLRRIQEDTGGFTAFIPWIFAPENTPLGKKVPETTAFDYLKTLAISRLYLDNIDHIQSSWLTPGIKVCQVGLQFGADDVGSILIEENVVYAAGVRNRTNEEELRRIITDAGYIPAQRDTLYRSYILKWPKDLAAGMPQSLN